MPRESDLTINHAAEELACSIRKVWDMISKGEVQTYMLGRVRRITRESLDIYKKSNMAAHSERATMADIANKMESPARFRPDR